MAEFQEVMRQWKRMCDTYTTDDAVSCCKGCPMSGRGCGSIYESGNADPDVIERETMSWAAEHPEPVYPTWLEWMKEQELCKDEFAYDDSAPFDHQLNMASTYIRNHILFDGERVALVTQKAYNPIPADIAEKLGLQPKEG